MSPHSAIAWLATILLFTLGVASARADDPPRRVVAGLDATGKAVVLFDTRIEPKSEVPGHTASIDLWTTHRSPAELSTNKDLADKGTGGIWPPDGGTVLRIIDVPPGNAGALSKLPVDSLMKTLGDHAPLHGRPPAVANMHRTRTVDYAVILTGTVDMMLEDTTLHFKPGDVVVQQAVNHAWINRGTEPCRILFVLLDSEEP
jgi:hypothetical protein